MEHDSKVRTCLWFENGGHDAGPSVVSRVSGAMMQRGKIATAALVAAAEKETAHG
jgi:hypothetical protein